MRRIDIYRTINEFYLNSTAYTNRSGIKESIYKKNVFSRIKESIKYLVGNAIWGPDEVFRPQYVGGDWVVHGTNNQRASLHFLLTNPNYMGVEIFSGLNGPPDIDFLPRKGLFQLWRYIPFFIVELFTNFKGFTGGLFHIVAYAGAYERHCKLLRLYRPKVIVVSNDHVSLYRSLVMAARAEGIPTVYVQHACVSTDFPSLISSLSLLEGEDSLSKYTWGGKKIYGEVSLVGIPRYDAYMSQVNESTRIDRIGIAYNLTSDIEELQKMVDLLARNFLDIEFVIRKHPRDERGLDLDALDNISYSDSKVTPAFTFIQSIDAVVAPNTSIHLEAALMNVYPIFIGYGKRSVVDTYEFVNNGLVDACRSDIEIVEKIEEIRHDRPVVRPRAAYYNAVLGTPDEGESGRVATEAIENFLSMLPE